MSDPFLSTAFGGVLDMLRPSKSPFGLIALSGSSALVFAARPEYVEAVGMDLWWATAVLLLATQTFVVLGTIRSRNVFDEKDYREHIRFARSIALAASQVGLVWILADLGGASPGLWRWGHVAATLVQVLVFFGYSLAAWAERDESVPRTNFVQLALVSVILLISAGAARVANGNERVVIESVGDGSVEDATTIARELVAIPLVLYALWAASTAAIVGHLLRHVRISFRPRAAAPFGTGAAQRQ